MGWAGQCWAGQCWAGQCWAGQYCVPPSVKGVQSRQIVHVWQIPVSTKVERQIHQAPEPLEQAIRQSFVTMGHRNGARQRTFHKVERDLERDGTGGGSGGGEGLPPPVVVLPPPAPTPFHIFLPSLLPCEPSW